MDLDRWNSEERPHADPLFGWLSTSLSLYGETVNVKSRVHLRSVGTRPFEALEPTNHPLAIEQRDEITLARVREIAESMLQD